MRIIEAINRIDSLKHNTYTQPEKIAWLSTLDAMAKAHVIDTHEGGEYVAFNGYDQNTDLNTVLLIPAPYEEAYLKWLEAQIDYANGEYDKYNNAIESFNTFWNGYKNYYNRTHMPLRNHVRFFGGHPKPSPGSPQVNQAAIERILTKIGDMNKLNTENKETLVAAINEALRGGADREEIKRIVDEYLKEHGTGGTVKTVNGIAPDENGNVQIPVSGGNANYNPVPKTAEMTIPVGVDEFGRLWVAPIYAPVEPTTTYTITSSLNNVESSNPSAVIAEGKPYTAALTAAEGYEIGKVIVTMGGVDITADVYADGVINIPAVTGDVIITASAAAVPTDIMSKFKYLGPTTYSPGTYTAWCPTGLVYDETRDVYAHFMNVQPCHWETPSACELWFNTIHPETLAHTKPVRIARTMEKYDGSMSSAGALGNCVKDGNYYMFSVADRGYYKSTDGGTTWTHEQYETGPDKNPWGCYVLDNGRMIMGSDTQNHTVYYSDDDGKNWTAVKSENFNEPTFVDFGGGVLMAICRRERDSENNIFAPWMHVSRDYGETWTEAVEMTTVGLMGENNCNAYIHDDYVELFVGCRYRTDSPQYTDALYEVRQYVMNLSNGPVDGFEYVNTVYRYKNDDNPQGIITDLTNGSDFSTPCIAIRDKSHALLTFFGPTKGGSTHLMIAVGNVLVDGFEIPSIIPETFAVSQTFSGTDSTLPAVCDHYGVEIRDFGGKKLPRLDGARYLDLSDIADGGFAHIRVSNYYPGNATWFDMPTFISVQDSKIVSASRSSGIGRSPLPSGTAAKVYGAKITTAPESVDMYAFIDDGYWWVHAAGSWFHVDSGGIDVTTLTEPTVLNVDVAEQVPYRCEGLTTYKTFGPQYFDFSRIEMIEYDKQQTAG